jgi:hypothetical protein
VKEKKLKGLVWNLEGFGMEFKEKGDKKKKEKKKILVSN